MAKKKKKEKKQKKSMKAASAGAKAGKKKKKGAGSKKGAKASDHKIRGLARRIVELTTANAEDLSELYADDVESIEMNMPAMVGLDAIRKKLEGWNDMVSDPSFTAANVWVDGNNVIIEWIGDVTLKATGKRAQLREIAIHEIKNGKIARERYYYDPAALQP